MIPAPAAATPIWLDPGVWGIIRSSSHALVGSYGFTYDDREDIQQEIALEVHRRMTWFDPGRSGPRTFVRRVAVNRIADLIAERQASCRDHRLCRRSVDEPVGQDGFERLGDTLAADETESLAGRQSLTWGQRSELRADVNTAISLLPSELAAVARLLTSVSVVEAARRLSLARVTVYRRIGRIRKVFAAAGLDGYRRSGAHQPSHQDGGQP
jgi:RNA polymerase sigma factor (sigma-70 family)